MNLLKLKKVEKTIRLFRYDLNQIPYDYIVEMRNRFKGLDLIDRVPEELWETWVRSLGWEDPLEKGMATHSSILAWRIP